MKIKTSDLVGAALDFAVELALGKQEEPYRPNYSIDWEYAGPIIGREDISLAGKDPLHDHWTSMTRYGTNMQKGPTPLIAAMRCFVASKLGNEVEIPDELLRNQDGN